MKQTPDLLTRWVLKFVPSEWNPTSVNLKPYWKKNKSYLSQLSCQLMEDRYVEIDFEPDIFVIDGSVRHKNIVNVDNFLKSSKRTRMVVVDNMETLSSITAGKFSGFKQFDFHEFDITKIPTHQKGKWCTSVWIKEDNTKRTTVQT